MRKAKPKKTRGAKVVGFRLSDHFIRKLEEFALTHRTGVGHSASINEAARLLVQQSLNDLFPDRDDR